MEEEEEVAEEPSGTTKAIGPSSARGGCVEASGMGASLGMHRA